MCWDASLVLLCMKQPRCIESLQFSPHLSHAQPSLSLYTHIHIYIYIHISIHMCWDASLVLLCTEQPRCIDSLQFSPHLSHAQPSIYVYVYIYVNIHIYICKCMYMYIWWDASLVLLCMEQPRWIGSLQFSPHLSRMRSPANKPRAVGVGYVCVSCAPTGGKPNSSNPHGTHK